MERTRRLSIYRISVMSVLLDYFLSTYNIDTLRKACRIAVTTMALKIIDHILLLIGDDVNDALGIAELEFTFLTPTREITRLANGTYFIDVAAALILVFKRHAVGLCGVVLDG